MQNDSNDSKVHKVDRGDSDPLTPHPIDMCLSLESRVQCVKVRIYNFIRAVGRGEITADNALHCLVEDYKNLGDMAKDLGRLSEMLAAAEDSNG